MRKKWRKSENNQTTVKWPQVKSETLLESYNESFLCWGVFEKHALSFCIACSFIHFTLFIHYFICAGKWTRIPLLYLKYIDCAFPTLHQQCSAHITKVKSCELPPFSNSLELDPSDKHQYWRWRIIRLKGKKRPLIH